MISGLFKKGVISDVGTIIVFGFLMSIALIIIYGVVVMTNTAFNDAGVGLDPAAQRFGSFKNQFVPLWDAGFLMLIVGLVLAGVIGLFIIDSHPILFIASFIGLMVLLVIAAALGNSFSTFANSDGIRSWATDFTFIPLLMNNFFETILIIGGIFAVALYAKIKR